MGVGFSAFLFAIPAAIILYLFLCLFRVYKKRDKEGEKKSVPILAKNVAREIGIFGVLLIASLISVLALDFKDSGSFEKDAGAGDYWRVPLNYPYQLTVIDGLDQACLSKWNPNQSMISCEIDKITEVTLKENVVAGKADGKYFALDQNTGSLLRSDNIDALKAAFPQMKNEELGQLKTIKKYYEDYWASHK